MLTKTKNNNDVTLQVECIMPLFMSKWTLKSLKILPQMHTSQLHSEFIPMHFA